MGIAFKLATLCKSKTLNPSSHLTDACLRFAFLVVFFSRSLVSPKAILLRVFALILDLQSDNTLAKLNEIANAHDVFTANRIKLNEMR